MKEPAAKTTGAGTVDKPLRREVSWTPTGDALLPYRTSVGSEEWTIRVNDFPDDQLYTLLIDGRDAESFDDWPRSWTRSKADPIVF